MRAVSHQGAVISGNEVNFLGCDELTYPQLTRLYLDFDFRVLSIASGRPDPQQQFLITYRNSRDTYTTAVSPAFDSLPDLEAYTDDNIIEILHQTLFAAADEEY